MVELKGSEKQIVWADKIRKEIWEELKWAASVDMWDRMAGAKHFGKRACSDLDNPEWESLPWVLEIFAHDSAAWWIDNRDSRLAK